MTTKMNPEIKAKWLTALRSGEYAQTTGTLERLESEHVSAAFCCLGVLCKIAADEGVVEREEAEGGYGRYDGADGMPPYGVDEWAGIDNMDRKFPVGDTSGDWAALPDLNDVYRLTFEQIADIIEEHL